MNKAKKFFNKKKKSILSFALAAVLAVSFNYSPISLLSGLVKKSNAYKSSSVQNYYPNTSTTNEKNITTGAYPSSLAEYFKGSSNNFNIKSYYDTRFSDLLAGYVHTYLSSIVVEDEDSVEYKTHYSQFLTSVDFDNILEYYNKNKAKFKDDKDIQAETFQEYAEYFVSHEITYQHDGTSKTIPAIHKNAEGYKSHEYLTLFYNGLANHLTTTTSIQDSVEVKDENGNIVGKFRDGVALSEKFYEQSVSYKRVKEFIDKKIEETVAIYTYDGETQNKNMAGIIADSAPGSVSFYYKDNSYESTTSFSRKFITHTNGHKNVYYMGTKNTNIESAASNKNIDSMVYDDDKGTNKTDLQKNPLRYKLIESGEYGYLDGHLTYYKYDSIPFEQYTDGNYIVYVIDDDVTVNEKATYDFLYFNVITQEEYDADLEPLSNTITNREIKSDYVESSYVNIPVPNNGDNDIFFTTISGITPSSDEDKVRFDNFVNLFVKDGKSNIYLKYKVSDNKRIFIDKDEYADFASTQETKYRYFDQVEKLDKSANGFNEEDYYVITNADFSSYYPSGSKHTLYFKKTIVEYEKLKSISYEDNKYETKSVPTIPFEENVIATNNYETISASSSDKKIYAVSESNLAHPNPFYTSISNDDLANAVHNEFVEVSKKLTDELNSEEGLTTTYKYYYRHTTETVNKIYISVKDDVYDKEKDNEVYKNLNYTVIKESEYNYKNYISIDKNDSNYNANFKLYYKYIDESKLSEHIYVKNNLTVELETDKNGNIIKDEHGNPVIKKDEHGMPVYKNAIYVVDGSVTGPKKTTYQHKDRNFIPITTEEFNKNRGFYTQITEDDANYNIKYTLYYKYRAISGSEKIVYTTDSKSDTYSVIKTDATDFLASDYELITPLDKNGNPDKNYVEGKNLYYKKIRIEGTEVYENYDQVTTYKYSSSSSISLSPNSYYVISFYVYTNGTYNKTIYDTDGKTVKEVLTSPMEASFYLEDTKASIESTKIENISTLGKWQKHYMFVATNSLLSSTVKLHMFMGDEKSILGTQSKTLETATGSVLFDDIKVTKINLTDYNKLSIDDKKVLSTTLKDEADAEKDALDEGGNKIYIDEYKNVIKVTVPATKINDTISVWNDTYGNTFDKMYNFDNMTDYFSNIKFNNADLVDGYTIPEDLWQMYISRDVSGQGNNYLLSQYQTAYKNGKLSVSVIDEKDIFEDKKDKEEEKEPEIDTDKPDEKDEDVKFIESTFIDNNKVLKLENTSRQLSLGLISNYFEVKQGEYYRLTVWIYSPDKEATATLSVNSILKTSTTQSNGSLLKSNASVSANIIEYKDTQINEYGWIPITFHIEGNSLHSQKCYLVLTADKNSTIYFDNISIEKITSSTYDTANSDSDTTTYCLSLTPSSSVMSAGVTNGFFNNITVSNNYNGTIDHTTPRTAESWTINKNSTGIIAGVVPTSSEYLAYGEDTFYFKYNNNDNLSSIKNSSLKNNIYAIYAPDSINHPLDEEYKTYSGHKNVYSINSTAISLSASSTYKLSFDFLKGFEFKGSVFANIYTGSIKDENLISSIIVDDTNIIDDIWNNYAFYISTDTSSTIYIEIGIKSATGTCFIRNVSNVKQTKTLDTIRDEIISDSDNSSNDKDLFNKSSFDGIKFIDLNAFEFSIHSEEKVESSNTYSSNEYNSDVYATSKFTTGQTGIAVASFYTSSESSSYTVTIDKVEYYIKSFTDNDGNITYKMFSDSNYKDEVKTLNGKSVSVDAFNKVIIGTENSTEYSIIETKKTNYTYTFEDDISLNNVLIDAAELNNNYSDKVMILANSYSTDYTLATPKFSTSLNKTAFYVLKVYVKTSSFDDDFGLNIDLDSSISRKWTNIDTTNSKYDDLRDENGFVCYQILISTNTSSISTFNVKFSLGNEKSTGTGYAIIADVELQTFVTEKLFNEYSSNYEDVNKDSNDTVIKSYFGAVGTSDEKKDETTTEEKEDEASARWATFFYIFSSLLLGIVLIIALVATLIKKHPIKVVKQEENDHDRTNTFVEESPKPKDVVIEKDDKTNSNKDNGFV